MPQPLLPEPNPLPGGGERVTAVDDVFEHYRIFRREDGSLWELGHGSMGVTYKAVDTNLDKLVALKIINAQFLGKETSQKRFRREARSAASLHHRHIAGVFHLGESGGNFFYAMEFVDGATIEALVKRDGPLPWRAAFGVTLQITRALMAAHAKGLVHRDIKPANIMLVDEVDEQGVAKLIDFGLAKSAVEEGGDGVTNVSGFLGTPLYASPEQCEEIPADIRSDIYSLGVTLWFMVTGEPPFQGTLGRVFHQQLYTAPPLEKLPADLPPAVRGLLERMLAKDREQRPQTPTDLRTEIEACLQVPAASSGVQPDPTEVAVSAPVEKTAPVPVALPKASVKTVRLSGQTISVPADREDLSEGTHERSAKRYRERGKTAGGVALSGRLSQVWRWVLALGLAVLAATVAAVVWHQRTPAQQSSAALQANPAIEIPVPSPEPGAVKAKRVSQAKSYLADALREMQFETDAKWQAHILGEIAAAQAKAGDEDGSRQNFTVALRTVQEIKEVNLKSINLAHIAAAQAKAGDIAGALRTAQNITQDGLKDMTLGEITAAQAKAGDVAGALRTAQDITSTYGNVRALGDIAAAQAKAGNKDGSQQSFASAVHMAQDIASPNGKDLAFEAIAVAQVKAADMAGALRTTQDIRDVSYKAPVLGEIAAAQAKAGNKDVSQQGFASAVRMAQDITNSYGKNLALGQIAAAQAKAGDVAGALRTAQDIKYDDQKADALKEIAAAQAKAGDVVGALRTARDNDFGGLKAFALGRIAAAQAIAGDNRAADATLASIETSADRTKGYIAVAEGLLAPVD